MRRNKFGAGLAVLLLCALAIAEPPFVKPDSVDFKSILTTAPTIDSQQEKDDLAKVLELQEKRTPEDVKRAQAEVNVTAFAFSDVLGPWFNPDDLPVTAKLMKEVGKEAKAISGEAKDFYGRKRPFQMDSRVKPAVVLEDTASYPSGHSTRATVWAIILADMFPEKKDALIARGNQIGDDRVLAGLHFPSDVEAGRVLGAAIAKKFLDDPEFVAQLEKAKEECLAGAKGK
jgi:acid phosphatase (class A)